MKFFFSKKAIIAFLIILFIILTVIFTPKKDYHPTQQQKSNQQKNAQVDTKDHHSQKKQSTSGHQFSEYLLALSWSPTYCLERDPQGNQPQCRLSGQKKHRFIVHGLWPQSGNYKMLQYCVNDSEIISDDIIQKYFYLMPSVGLMKHEWNKHGTCSNLNQTEYFAKIETLYQQFDVEKMLTNIKQTTHMSLVQLKSDVIQSYPELNDKNFVIKCRKNKLSEVRICLNKTNQLRECRSFERKSGACRKDSDITIPF